MEPAGQPTQDRRLLELACSRILSASRAMARAYDFDISPGPHDEPWTAAYHRDAVNHYAQALPRSYQIDIESLFRHCAQSMNQGTVPASLAEDWTIIKSYLTNAADSIAEMLHSSDLRRFETAYEGSIDTSEEPPPVVRYDRLAALTTQAGSQRLESAAPAVHAHAATGPGPELDDDQRRLLEGVSAGLSVSDLAAQFGYSQRSIFRELSKLWDTLGVPDRTHGLRKAEEQGLIQHQHN